MGKFLQFISLLFICVLNAQESKKLIPKADTIHIEKFIYVVDTVYIKTVAAIKVDTIKSVMVHSDYNKLFEETLNQKQLHYDSALNTLNLIATIFGLLITLLTVGFGLYGFRSIKQIKQEIKEDFNSEKQRNIERIRTETRRLTSNIYDKQLNEINEKIFNIERFSEDSIRAFQLKEGEDEPVLKEDKKSDKPTKNPFN